MSTYPCFKRFAGVASTKRETGKGWNTRGGEGRGEGEEGSEVGRVLTELINELALRDKA